MTISRDLLRFKLAESLKRPVPGEEHARQFPALHANSSVTLCLDEVQVVPGWEGLVHRFMEVAPARVEP